MTDPIPLDMGELRAIVAYAGQCAQTVLQIFAALHPEDPRPQAALAAAEAFAAGGARGKLLRDTAWGALRAAREAGSAAAADAARAASAAAGAAYLHPLAKATQVRHILGAAAHATRAVELAAPGDPAAVARHLSTMRQLATPTVRAVLARYPAAPAGGGGVGALLRQLDRTLRD
jgi:hypothetical protein